jgi:DeoR/GlpR family transcriptional regulator of sugar metabolism
MKETARRRRANLRALHSTYTRRSRLARTTGEWTGGVLAAQRHMVILDEVRRNGAVRVSDLTQVLGVSEMTIRRDLDALAAEGLLAKVRGGATSFPPSIEEPGFEAKWLSQREEKEAIAKEAIRHVAPNTAVGVTAGTTTWTLAHELRDVPGLTIVTNSLQVAQVFYTRQSDGQTIVLTGGVRTPSDALVGPVAVSAVRQLHLDVVFLGVHGMAVNSGFTTPNMLEADVDRAFVAAARRLIVVADHTKWGMVGISTIAHLEEADVLISDDELDLDARDALETRVGKLVLVSARRNEVRNLPDTNARD